MFNQKASDQERQLKLETLLRKEYSPEGEEDDKDEEEAYNDEELNEIIARNDYEYELFTKMDQERY